MNQTRETIKMDTDEAILLLTGDHENFKTISDDIVDQGRWSTYHEMILQRLSDQKFFKTDYSTGSTEQQDDPPFEYGAKLTEVFAIQKMVTVYE